MAEEEFEWPSWSATAAAFSVVAISLATMYRKHQQDNSLPRLESEKKAKLDSEHEQPKELEQKRADEETKTKERTERELQEQQPEVREEQIQTQRTEEKRIRGDSVDRIVTLDGEKVEEPTELVLDVYSIEEMNESGLVRGRKTTSIREGRRQKQVYQMEDVCFVEVPFDKDPNKALFAVFDGHAGRFAAEAARSILSKHVKLNIDESNGSVDFMKVFSGMEAELVAENKFDCEGCTATVAYIHRHENKRYLQVANVGDSTAFLGRRNEATALSVDHKVSNPQERERIRSMGVPLEDRHTRLPTIGLAVSRALCDFFAKEVNSGLSGEPYVHPVVQIAPNDRLIIASDGLWDILTGQQAFNLTSSYSSAKDIAKSLIEAAVSSVECQDNVTVVVVLL